MFIRKSTPEDLPRLLEIYESARSFMAKSGHPTEDGIWQNNSPYGVIHRLAGDGSVKGIGAHCINWC